MCRFEPTFNKDVVATQMNRWYPSRWIGSIHSDADGSLSVFGVSGVSGVSGVVTDLIKYWTEAMGFHLFYAPLSPSTPSTPQIKQKKIQPFHLRCWIHRFIPTRNHGNYAFPQLTVIINRVQSVASNRRPWRRRGRH